MTQLIKTILPMLGHRFITGFFKADDIYEVKGDEVSDALDMNGCFWNQGDGAKEGEEEGEEEGEKEKELWRKKRREKEGEKEKKKKNMLSIIVG